MSMIILYLAYPSQKEKSFFTNFHFLIAIFIASITTVYPEGLLFVLIPIVLITIFRYIFMDRAMEMGIEAALVIQGKRTCENAPYLKRGLL